MMNPFVNKWKGNPVKLQLPGRDMMLGEGGPAVTVTIKDNRVARAFLLSKTPSLVFGEAYMRGDLEISGGVEGFLKVLEGYYEALMDFGAPRPGFFKKKISQEKAKNNARSHYNVGNDFYKLWLDKNLLYTCAYFPEGTEDIHLAQLRKMELVCRKADLRPGQKIVDLGCGWGGLIMYAAEKFGVHATGVVAAEEQGEYIMEEVKRRGLEGKVDVVIDDWRTAKGQYDRVVSVGMMEHVGQNHYGEFFQKIRELLIPGNIAFVHTIGVLQSAKTDPWIHKYIFPDGWFPTIGEIINGAAGVGLAPIHEEDLRPHYAQTLRKWSEAFEATLDETRKMEFGMDTEEFIRMWRMYLLGSEAAFRWGGLHLWQVVLADKGATIPSKWDLDVTNVK